MVRSITVTEHSTKKKRVYSDFITQKQEINSNRVATKDIPRLKIYSRSLEDRKKKKKKRGGRILIFCPKLRWSERKALKFQGSFFKNF